MVVTRKFSIFRHYAYQSVIDSVVRSQKAMITSTPVKRKSDEGPSTSDSGNKRFHVGESSLDSSMTSEEQTSSNEVSRINPTSPARMNSTFKVLRSRKVKGYNKK